MNNFDIIDKIGIPPANKVLVKVSNSYSVRKTTGGIFVANAAHEEAEADSEGFNLSEWIIRKGEVVKISDSLTMGDYDWKPNLNEIKEGDIVHWPIVRFFNYPAFKDIDGDFCC